MATVTTRSSGVERWRAEWRDDAERKPRELCCCAGWAHRLRSVDAESAKPCRLTRLTADSDASAWLNGGAVVQPSSRGTAVQTQGAPSRWSNAVPDAWLLRRRVCQE